MYSLFEILQILYYLSCIGLFIVSIIGLKQLSITKKISNMNAKRDSLKLANSQIKYYSTYVINLQNILNNEIKKHNIKLYDNAKFSLDGDSVTVNLNSSKEEIKKTKNITTPLVDVLNAMECFSSYFTSELADEKVAFRAVGKTFCNTVKKLMPEYVYLNPEGYFTNTFYLFLQWNKKFEHINLLKEKKSIEQKLMKIDNKKIKPLGT